MKKILLRVALVLCCTLCLTVPFCCRLLIDRIGSRSYTMFVLNESAEQVVVYYQGYLDAPIESSVEPCSVYIKSHLAAPVPISVWVVDSTGREVLTAELEPRKVHPEARKQVDVLIPADEPMACPSTIPNRYVVVVDNDDDEPVCVFIDDVKLGCVEPNSVTTLGPVEGTLTYDPWIRVKDMEGARVLTSWEVGYPLSAEVGEYRIRVDKDPDTVY